MGILGAASLRQNCGSGPRGGGWAGRRGGPGMPVPVPLITTPPSGHRVSSIVGQSWFRGWAPLFSGGEYGTLAAGETGRSSRITTDVAGPGASRDPRQSPWEKCAPSRRRARPEPGAHCPVGRMTCAQGDRLRRPADAYRSRPRHHPPRGRVLEVNQASSISSGDKPTRSRETPVLGFARSSAAV